MDVTEQHEATSGLCSVALANKGEETSVGG